MIPVDQYMTGRRFVGHRIITGMHRMLMSGHGNDPVVGESRKHSKAVWAPVNMGKDVFRARVLVAYGLEKQMEQRERELLDCLLKEISDIKLTLRAVHARLNELEKKRSRKTLIASRYLEKNRGKR